MKRFLMRVVPFCLLQLSIGALVLWSASVDFQQGYLAALGDKIDLLDEPGPPRILFVGGSSVAFGIDSGQVERALNMRPINLGLHAGLGLDFPLRLVERHVRAGDLVVLMPEYSNLLSRRVPNRRLRESLLRQCPRAARYLDDAWPDPKVFVDKTALPELACRAETGIRRLPRNLSDLLLKKLGVNLAPRLRLYSRASFNGQGDMVAHHEMPRPTSVDVPPLAEFDERVVSESVLRLNQCVQRCRRQGADVVYAHQPLPEGQYRSARQTVERVTGVLESQLMCSVVTRHDGGIFPLEDFFDCAGHLTFVGKQKRTSMLVGGLIRNETSLAAVPPGLVLPGDTDEVDQAVFTEPL